MTEPLSDTTALPRTVIKQTFVLGVIVAVAVIVRLYLILSTHSTSEDFYITLRYAENLARGHGLVYNAGERVLGTTTPLYAVLLAGVEWLGLGAATWGKLLNVAADGLSCLLIWRLARSAGRPGSGLIAAALFAISPPNLTWAISGMETSLVTACTLALFVVTANRKPMAIAVASSLLYLLRVDGLLAVAIVYGALAWSAKREDDLRSVLRSGLLFLLLCAPWTLFAWGYYGSPLPTSALAKLTVYAWMSKGAFPNLQPFLLQMTHTKLHLLLLAGAVIGTIVGVIRLPRLRPAILWMLAYYAGMALSKGFLFGWYFVPPTGVYFLMAAIGWESMVRRATDNGGRKSLSVMQFTAGAALLLGLAGLPKVKSQIAADQQMEDSFRKPIGVVLKETVRPGERVMLEPIGYIGYFSGARVLDAVGLVSPEVIPYYRPGAVSPYLDMMHDLEPEWVLLRAGEYQDARRARVPADRALEAHYKVVRTFADPAAPPGSTPGFFLLKRVGTSDRHE